MRITLVISVYGNGGASRVLSIMANYWAAQGHDIILISLSHPSEDWFRLDPRVRRVGLDLVASSTHIGHAIYQNARRVIRLRRALRQSQPHVVFSFIDTSNVLTLMASWGLGFPVIVSERTDPRRHDIGLLWRRLRAVLYRRAAAVVVQTSAIQQWACRLVGENAVHVIPNPVNPELRGSLRASDRQGVSRTVVAVGRLGPEKGFDLLIQAFGRCATKHVGWSLVIVGEGSERANLEAIAMAAGIKDRVRFPGAVGDPFPILSQADLFVLSSRYEGFPNVLLEAMACGLAVIAADCPSGPRDIIREGVDGVLVPPNDVDALTAAMDRLMANPVERQRLGTRAVDVVERFSIEKVMNMWDEVATHARRRAGQ